jgi:hypothetical protein
MSEKKHSADKQPPKPRRALKKSELEAHLEDQLDFLETSAKAFDEGKLGEAKRLALALRVLLHNTNHSYSLLHQLSLEQKAFVGTASPYHDWNMAAYHGLLTLLVGSHGASYRARLDLGKYAREMPFQEWWKEVVIEDANKRKLSRQELVLIAANQDGGGHVDPALDEMYDSLVRKNTLGWQTFTEGPQNAKPISDDPTRLTIRQIAFEVLQTFRPRPAAEAKIEQAMPESYMEIENIQIRKIPKRSAKCPCGSGLRYKHCHGKDFWPMNKNSRAASTE